MVKVYLKIYDLSPINRSFRGIGLGVFHSGVTIGGNVEYCYGSGGDDFSSGISSFPISSNEVNPFEDEGDTKLYKIFEFEVTEYSRSEITNLISDMGMENRWKCGSYSIFTNNCNSWTYEFLKRILTPEEFAKYPTWVLRSQNLVQFILKISLAPVLVLMGGGNILTPPVGYDNPQETNPNRNNNNQNNYNGRAHFI